MEDNRHEGKSLKWIATASMIFVAIVGWGLMACSYDTAMELEAQETEESFQEAGPVSVRRMRGQGAAMAVTAVVMFAYNSVAWLPQLFTVIGWHFSHRLWLPIAVVVVEGLVLGGVFGLQKLEDNLNGGPKKPKRKKAKTSEVKKAKKKRPRKRPLDE
ncbi:MAG: hypothetical protein R3C49_12815 [Planctomycetaceae bacterium]